MREIISWIIYDENGDILVVDKPKEDWKILTILPWWKKANWKNDTSTLTREIQEELGVKGEVWKYIFQIEWATPTSNIQSIIKVYVFKIIKNWKINANAEIENPRFLSSEKIINLHTTTKITREIVKKLIEKTS